MPKGHYHRLSKEDKKRHFPEKEGGKGDLRFRGRRGSHEVNQELDAYRNSPYWDTVDEDEREKQQKEHEKRLMREEKARLSREICGK